jgi:hypothetical protein
MSNVVFSLSFNRPSFKFTVLHTYSTKYIDIAGEISHVAIYGYADVISN